MKCEICEREDTGATEEWPVCDRCWYGMRLDPERWKEELKEEGIEVERHIGCVPIPGGFICGNPYKKKTT